MVAAKLTLATPTSAFNIFGCQPPAGGGSPPATCNQYGGSVQSIVSETPKNFLGYRDVDLQATKNFTVWNGVSAYGRVDVLNVFNFNNYDPNGIQFGTYGASPTYNREGPIIGVPFTVKFSIGARF